MKPSLTLILGAVACVYSTACVLWFCVTQNAPPDPLLYPIYPGIWVGVWVNAHIPSPSLWPEFVAGIGTMTALGGLLGWVFETVAGLGYRGAGQRGAQGD